MPDDVVELLRSLSLVAGTPLGRHEARLQDPSRAVILAVDIGESGEHRYTAEVSLGDEHFPVVQDLGQLRAELRAREDEGRMLRLSVGGRRLGPFAATLAYALGEAERGQPGYAAAFYAAVSELAALFEEDRESRVCGIREQAGLLSELLVLDCLADIAPDKALDAWVGPEMRPHDFESLPGGDIEVKSTLSPNRLEVRVNGFHQLDAPDHGSLQLMLFRLAKSDGSESINIPDVIRRIVGKVGHKFYKKLAATDLEIVDLSDGVQLKVDNTDGPSADSGNTWANFEVEEVLVMSVDEATPRIVPSMIAGGIPEAVTRASYTVAFSRGDFGSADWVSVVREISGAA